MKQKIKNLSWKKKLLLGIIVLIGIGIVYRMIQAKKINYSFDTVTRAAVTEVVTETGNVAVSGEYDIPSPSTGFLSEIYVKNGDTVIVGQKLFSVTSTATPQQKAAAWAAYASAKSSWDAANAALFSLQSSLYSTWKVYMDIAQNSTYQNADGSDNTGNRVLTPFTIAQDNWHAAEANYKNQQSAITAASGNVTNTYLAYQATQNAVVTSPVAGTVNNLDGVVGSSVVAGTMASAGIPAATFSPVLILSTSSIYTVKTTVNEVDINKIKVGNPVSITFDAIKDKLFTGKNIQTDTFGINVAGVINYSVFASVDDGDGFIKPGMTANLTIETNKHENVLTVLNAAVRPYKGAKAVQTIKNGSPQYDPVTTGIKGLDRTEITSGVTAGEKVIIGNTTKTVIPLGPGS